MPSRTGWKLSPTQLGEYSDKRPKRVGTWREIKASLGTEQLRTKGVAPNPTFGSNSVDASWPLARSGESGLGVKFRFIADGFRADENPQHV